MGKVPPVAAEGGRGGKAGRTGTARWDLPYNAACSGRCSHAAAREPISERSKERTLRMTSRGSPVRPRSADPDMGTQLRQHASAGARALAPPPHRVREPAESRPPTSRRHQRPDRASDHRRHRLPPTGPPSARDAGATFRRAPARQRPRGRRWQSHTAPLRAVVDSPAR